MEKDNRESIQPQKKVVLNDSDNVSREFTIQEEIGRGGSCIVYEATYEKDGVKRICRLKEFFPYGKEYDVYRGEGSILKITPAGEERFNNKKERFIEGCKKQMTIYTELSAARNSTVYVQSLYYGNNTVYCGMICDQGDSYDKIKDSGIKDVLETVKSTAQVLQHYHKAGYLHLDIKPANIFVLNETRELVKLFDFDSIIEQEEIRKGHIFSLGSSGYRAPELYKPNVKKIDVTADIYSLGAIVFERIFGRKVRLSDAFDSDIELPYDNKLFANSSSKLYKPLMKFLEKTCLSKSSYRRYQNVEELITAIDNMLEYTEIRFPLKKNLPSTISSFKGREELINDICDRIKNKGERKIFLHGQAGIGKTSLAIKCANELRDNYDGYFIVYRGTMKETIINLDFVNYNPLDEKNQYKSSDVIYKEKMELLSAYDDKTLLIIDNFDSNTDDLTQMENEPEYREVVNCGITVIITSRNYFEGCIDVNNLSDDELFDLMRCFYTKAEQYKETMYEIIHAVDNHTLVVELVAKTLEESWGEITPSQMLELMKESQFEYEGFDEVTSLKDATAIDGQYEYNAKLYAHIRKLFDISKLSAEERVVMTNASLLPKDGMGYKLFMEFEGASNKKTLKLLVCKGWIQLDKVNNRIKLHPLVKYVASTTLEPDDNKFVKNLYQREVHEYYNILEIKDVLISNERLFQKREKEVRITYYRLIAHYANITNNPYEAIKYYQKEINIYININEQSDEKHYNIANIYALIANIYDYQLGDPFNSIEYLKKELTERKKIKYQSYTDAWWSDFTLNYSTLSLSYNKIGYVTESEYYRAELDKLVIETMQYFKKKLNNDNTPFLEYINNYISLCWNYISLNKDKKVLNKLINIDIIINIIKKMRENYKENSLEDFQNLYVTLNNASGIHMALGNYDAAIDLKKSQAELIKSHPYENTENNDSTIDLTMATRIISNPISFQKNVYREIAELYAKKGDLKSCIEYYKKCILISEQTTPNDKKTIADMYYRMGSQCSVLGYKCEAILFDKKALDIYEHYYEDYHKMANICSSLGLENERDNLTEALTYYERGVQYVKYLNESSIRLAQFYENIGNCYRRIKNFSKEMEFYEKALEIYEKNLVKNKDGLYVDIILDGYRKIVTNNEHMDKKIREYFFERVSKFIKLYYDNRFVKIAYVCLAWCYKTGYGCTSDKEKALEYYKKARDLGENGLDDTIDKLEHEIAHTE